MDWEAVLEGIWLPREKERASERERERKSEVMDGPGSKEARARPAVTAANEPTTHGEARVGRSMGKEETKEIRKTGGKRKNTKKTTMVKSSAHEDEQTEPGGEEKEQERS